MRDKPAVGTCPGTKGWPEINLSDLTEIINDHPDWVTIGFSVFGAPNPLIIVYGNNAQAAWTIYLNGLRVLAASLERDGETEMLAYLRAQVGFAKRDVEATYEIALEGNL